MSEHQFQLGAYVRILRGSGPPLESFIDHHLPRDDMVYMVVRLLPPDTTEPVYHVKASDGMVRLIHESQLVVAAE